jgi:diguanylate cyclase (GGDEF)-like protein/PAS domain S-box-containing protein
MKLAIAVGGFGPQNATVGTIWSPQREVRMSDEKCVPRTGSLTASDTMPPSILSLKEAREHFRAIVEYTDDAIISKSLDGTISSWNAGAQALFGYSPGEMLGQSMLVLFPAGRLDEERFILERIMVGEKVDHFETQRVHKDGSLIHVSVTISPIRDKLGQVVGASNIARNISERVRLESTARVFESIVQSSDDAIIGKNLDSSVTSWNPGAQRIFGYAAHEMMGRSIRCLIPAERHHEEALILERIRKGERITHFETQRLHKDGRMLDVSVTVSPIHDQTGRVVGASKIARNITEQKQAQSRLMLISKVFTHTGEGVVITDPQGRILEVNEAFTRITGYDYHEVVGQLPQMFRSSRQGPEVYAKLLTDLQQHGHAHGEIWSRRKDGDSYAGLLTISTVLGEGGVVLNYVCLFADITPLRQNQERLEHVAHFDSLTDLPNRLLLADRLKQGMVLARRQQQSLAVLYLDLDGFKTVNDNHGHGVGDELLLVLSRRMKLVLREVDTLARMGGDEFVAVLMDVHTVQDCIRMVERVLHACSEPVLLDGKTLQVSASVGVTLYPQDDVDADQLMRHADQAMYQAKQAGKNRYQFFDSDQELELKSRGEQLQRIAKALRDGEFALYYQPKVNMRTGEVLGLEALIRWISPSAGILAPSVFLPVIEGLPLSDAVAAWVLDSALSQMHAWSHLGMEPTVSINIGARQLQHAGFMADLQERLAMYPQVRPANLELEILETSALADMDRASAVMRSCVDMGVQFAVDDFGTGYSSLTYLKRLPAATLKIDQSFVRDMLVDKDDLAIVKGVIGLATAFQRKVIAEGVETVQHGLRLLELGCDCAQGFGIARPMPAEAVPLWLAQWKPDPLWRTPMPAGA